MDIELIEAHHLRDILRLSPVKIANIAFRASPAEKVSAKPPPSSAMFKQETITSHDLVNMLLTLENKIERFCERMRFASEELEK